MNVFKSNQERISLKELFISKRKEITLCWLSKKAWQNLITFIQNLAQIKCQDDGSLSNLELHKEHTGKQNVIDITKSKSVLREKLLQEKANHFHKSNIMTNQRK